MAQKNNEPVIDPLSRIGNILERSLQRHLVLNDDVHDAMAELADAVNDERKVRASSVIPGAAKCDER